MTESTIWNLLASMGFSKAFRIAEEKHNERPKTVCLFFVNHSSNCQNEMSKLFFRYPYGIIDNV